MSSTGDKLGLTKIEINQWGMIHLITLIEDFQKDNSRIGRIFFYGHIDKLNKILFRVLPDKLIATIMAVLEIVGSNDKAAKAKVKFVINIKLGLNFCF